MMNHDPADSNKNETHASPETLKDVDDAEIMVYAGVLNSDKSISDLKQEAIVSKQTKGMDDSSAIAAFMGNLEQITTEVLGDMKDENSVNYLPEVKQVPSNASADSKAQ